MLLTISTFGPCAPSTSLQAVPDLPPSNSSPATPPPANDLQRMAQLLRGNDRLFADLRALRAQIREALAYLNNPSANHLLALARLHRLQTRRSRTLALLRSHRIEAQTLLARYPSS